LKQYSKERERESRYWLYKRLDKHHVIRKKILSLSFSLLKILHQSQEPCTTQIHTANLNLNISRGYYGTSPIFKEGKRGC